MHADTKLQFYFTIMAGKSWLDTGIKYYTTRTDLTEVTEYNNRQYLTVVYLVSYRKSLETQSEADIQRDPAFKKPLFKNESRPISNTMRPVLC